MARKSYQTSFFCCFNTFLTKKFGKMCFIYYLCTVLCAHPLAYMRANVIDIVVIKKLKRL